MNMTIRCVLGLLLVSVSLRSATSEDQLPRLREALTFHASFDHGVDADFARGDRQLLHAPSMDQRQTAHPGLPPGGEVTRQVDGGRFGDALQFHKSQGPMVFYRADKNVPAFQANWSGTLSFWLSADPPGELNEGFCDPIQITSKSWDDAAVFVEFEKRSQGIPFRLGVYADKSIWNPMNRNFADIPAKERPLASVPKPPFSRGQWTHVAIALSHFNTGKPDGTSKLFLNGELAGEISPRQQTFTWDDRQSAIMLGLNFIGLMDDLAVFQRELSNAEVKALYGLKAGVRELHPTR